MKPTIPQVTKLTAFAGGIGAVPEKRTLPGPDVNKTDCKVDEGRLTESCRRCHINMPD